MGGSDLASVPAEGRWVALPLVTGCIGRGSLLFISTPDLSWRIVRYFVGARAFLRAGLAVAAHFGGRVLGDGAVRVEQEQELPFPGDDAEGELAHAVRNGVRHTEHAVGR